MLLPRKDRVALPQNVNVLLHSVLEFPFEVHCNENKNANDQPDSNQYSQGPLGTLANAPDLVTR
jgi:hypothetical protein